MQYMRVEGSFLEMYFYIYLLKIVFISNAAYHGEQSEQLAQNLKMPD